MSLNKILLLILVLFVLNLNTSSQTKPDSLKNKENTLDVNFVAGNENGVRIGIRYYFLKKYSVEASYGTPLTAIGGVGSYLYEIGVNVFPFKNNGVICGLMGIYSYLPYEDSNDPYKSYTISPFIGILIPRNNGLMFHSRGGINLQYRNLFIENKKKFRLSFAFELGFAIDIF